MLQLIKFMNLSITLGFKNTHRARTVHVQINLIKTYPKIKIDIESYKISFLCNITSDKDKNDLLKLKKIIKDSELHLYILSLNISENHIIDSHKIIVENKIKWPPEEEMSDEDQYAIYTKWATVNEFKSFVQYWNLTSKTKLLLEIFNPIFVYFNLIRDTRYRFKKIKNSNNVEISLSGSHDGVNLGN